MENVKVGKLKGKLNNGFRISIAGMARTKASCC
jgi:hypothetical protein